MNEDLSRHDDVGNWLAKTPAAEDGFSESLHQRVMSAIQAEQVEHCRSQGDSCEANARRRSKLSGSEGSRLLGRYVPGQWQRVGRLAAVALSALVVLGFIAWERAPRPTGSARSSQTTGEQTRIENQQRRPTSGIQSQSPVAAREDSESVEHEASGFANRNQAIALSTDQQTLFAAWTPSVTIADGQAIEWSLIKLELGSSSELRPNVRTGSAPAPSSRHRRETLNGSHRLPTDPSQLTALSPRSEQPAETRFIHLLTSGMLGHTF